MFLQVQIQVLEDQIQSLLTVHHVLKPRVRKPRYVLNKLGEFVGRRFLGQKCGYQDHEPGTNSVIE